METKNDISKYQFIRPHQAWMFGMSKSHLLTLIKNGDVTSYLPTPKLRLIKVQDLISYIENTKIEVNDDEN